MDLVFNYLTPKIKHEEMQGLDFAIRMAETRLPDSKIPGSMHWLGLNWMHYLNSPPNLSCKRRDDITILRDAPKNRYNHLFDFAPNWAVDNGAKPKTGEGVRT